MKKAKKIALYNMKGGCGKTFTVLSIAVGLANKGYKVLLIDCDYQGNSSYKNLDDYREYKNLNGVVMNQYPIEEAIYPTKTENLDIIPNNYDMKLFGYPMLAGKTDREFLKRSIENAGLDEKYDYIVFDNNPSYDIMLYNMIFCCDLIIIPVNVDMYSAEGVMNTESIIVDAINSTAVDINVKYNILITRVANTNKSRTWSKDVKDKWGDLVFDTTIRLQSSPAEKQTTEDGYFAINHALPHKDPEIITDKKTGESKTKTFPTNLGTDYQDFVDEIERRTK